MANIEKLEYKGDVYDISDAKAMHQDDIGPWMPDFDNLPVLETHEFDISGTSIYKVCERANVTSIDDATDVIAYRCTVTGTNIHSVTDVIFRLTPTVNTAPNVTAYNRTLSTTAATTGLRYIYTVYPKAVNTNYTYQSCVAMYNSTKRHVKIEVFKTNSNWTFVNATTQYSYNSTYQTRNELSIYTRLGYISNSTAYFNANTATSATYISSYAPLYNSSYSLLTAGAALSSNTIAFVSSEDNKVYPISNTTKAINTNWPLMWVSNAVSSGGAISYSYLRVFGTITPGSTVTKDTFAAGQTVYCRCTLSNGNVYSNNLLTPTITPGYAYVKFGIAYSATVVVENTYGAFYFYKDTNGNVSNINGYSIGAERASSVSLGYSTASGSYPILYGSADASTIPPPTTVVPNINSALTFSPSTGILSATGFSGSGAGLTNIPLSGIQGGDELLPTKTLHIYHDVDLDTYEFTDSLTTQEIKDILDDASDGTINLQISMVDVDTSKLLKYYQSGNMFIAKYLIFEDTPAIDMTTYQNHSLQSYFAIVWSAGSDTFQFATIPGDDLATVAQQFMQLLAGKEDLSNKVTSISSSSTDDEYPSAKCVYDAISGISPGGGAGDDCYYGYCGSSATTPKKVVSISNSGYTITDHVRLFVYFNSAHTYSSSKPYLSIDDVTYNIRYYDLSISAEESTSMINNILYNKRYMEFYFMTMSGSLTAIALPDNLPTLFSPYRTNNTRITNLNNFSTANGAYMKYVIASSNTVTTGKPKINGADASAMILHMNWDNNTAYAAQLALQVGSTTVQGGMAYRRQNGQSNGWYDWKTLADEDNIGTLTDVEHCYTAALTPAGDGTIVFPIDGTKYKITQITLINFDLNATAGFGISRMFVVSNNGSGGYQLGTTDYFSLASTSTDITMTISSSSSSGMQDSTNLHVQVRYVKL